MSADTDFDDIAEFEPEGPYPHARFWLFYHVSLKGLQAGAIAGMSTFVLRIPSLIRAFRKQRNKKQRPNHRKYSNQVSAFETPLGTLQRCMFHGCMHAFSIGMLVASYHLSYMPLDLVEDRTYRIFNTA
eukprot:205504_1